MEYEAAIAYLERHIGNGIKPGLERIATLMEMMGHPEDGYPIIHVAGTNGKTSTARMATMLTVAHGLNTGTFTSPHLERIEERISANGRIASRAEFAQAVEEVAAFADIYEERYGRSLSYFELTAAMAFTWFAEQAVDAAVIEVGLGGRLDATNVARGEVSVVTTIGLEHTDLLGTTIADIAGEKLGIVKPGTVLVTGPLPAAALEMARQVAGRLDVQHRAYGVDYRLEAAQRALGGWYLEVEGVYGEYQEILLPLHGRHQTLNLAVAVAAVEALVGRELDHDAVREGAASITSPGRLEVIAHDPLVLLDGAHNPDGFSVLGSALREEFGEQPWTLVMAVMEDKDLGRMLPELKGMIGEVIATEVSSARSLPAPKLAESAQALLGVSARSEPTPARAVETALELAGREGRILVTGSLYLVGTARSQILGDGSVHPNER